MGAMCTSENSKAAFRSNPANEHELDLEVSEGLKKSRTDGKISVKRYWAGIKKNSDFIKSKPLNLYDSLNNKRGYNASLELLADIVSITSLADSKKYTSLYSSLINPHQDIFEYIEEEHIEENQEIDLNEDEYKVGSVYDINNYFLHYNQKICQVENFNKPSIELNNSSVNEKKEILNEEENLDLENKCSNNLDTDRNPKVSNKILESKIEEENIEHIPQPPKKPKNSKNIFINLNEEEYKPVETIQSTKSEKVKGKKSSKIFGSVSGAKSLLSNTVGRNQKDKEKLQQSTLNSQRKNSKSNVSVRKNSQSSKKDALVSSRHVENSTVSQRVNTHQNQLISSINSKTRNSREFEGEDFRDPTLDFDFAQHIHDETEKIKTNRINKISSCSNLIETGTYDKIKRDQNSNPSASSFKVINNPNAKDNRTSNNRYEPVPVYKPVVRPSKRQSKFTSSPSLGNMTNNTKIINQTNHLETNPKTKMSIINTNNNQPRKPSLNTSNISKGLNKSNNYMNRSNIRGKTSVQNEGKQPIANIKINLKDLIKENVIQNYNENNRYTNIDNISTIAKNKSFINQNLNTFQDFIDKFTFTDKSHIKKSPIKSSSPFSRSRDKSSISHGEQNGIYTYQRHGGGGNLLSKSDIEMNDEIDVNDINVQLKSQNLHNEKNKMIYKIDLTESEIPNFSSIGIENEEPQQLYVVKASKPRNNGLDIEEKNKERGSLINNQTSKVEKANAPLTYTFNASNNPKPFQKKVAKMK